MPQKTLTQALLEQKLIEKGVLEDIKRQEKLSGKPLEELLVEKGILQNEVIGKVQAECLGFPYEPLEKREIPLNVLQCIPYSVASKHCAIVFEKNGDGAKVAMANPKDFELISLIEKKLDTRVIPYYATMRDVREGLKQYKRDIQQRFEELLSVADIPKLLDTCIGLAFQNRASDIHFEPYKKYLLVRFRIDGILHDIIELPQEMKELITTRIKVLANLRTDEHRIPQDGRFNLALESSDEVALRVSIIPIYDGEKIVLRLLTKPRLELTLDDLGFLKKDKEKIEKATKKTHGMVLATGPTGCGKTTTLYALIKKLATRDVNITTIEDPIEYRIHGINQIQISNRIGLTFANGLRSILRQDPDIIMVGEIRDEETASIAANAALTGHLVLATLHTNDAPQTLTRFLEMGIEAFLVASTVNLIIAQRLARRLCKACAKKESLTEDEKNRLQKEYNIDMDATWIAQGCDICSHTGYKGRIAIVEVLEVTEEIKKLLRANALSEEIRKAAKKQNMTSMIEDGLEKVRRGETTLEEIFRVIHDI